MSSITEITSTTIQNVSTPVATDSAKKTSNTATSNTAEREPVADTEGAGDSDGTTVSSADSSVTYTPSAKPAASGSSSSSSSTSSSSGTYTNANGDTVSSETGLVVTCTHGGEHKGESGKVKQDDESNLTPLSRMLAKVYSQG